MAISGSLAGAAGHFDQRVDGIDRSLHLLVAEHHGAQHDVFGEFLGFGLDHQHRSLGAGHDQVHLAGLELGGGRVEDVLAVDVADAGSADGAVERKARDRERRRGADHRRDVGVDLGVQRQHGDDDLDFIHEAIREERADRTIDQARGEDFLLAGTAFALEETTGDAARGVELLDVVDGEREEVLARAGFLGADHGGEHHRLVHVDNDGTAGLASNLTGFERDGVGAVGEGFLDCGRQGVFLFRLMQRTTTACGGPPERAARHHGNKRPPGIADRAAQTAKSRRGRKGTHRLCWLTPP